MPVKLRYPLLLALVVAGSHLYGLLAFGATFWVDSSCYIQLGEALKSPEAYRVYCTVFWPPWRDSHFGLMVLGPVAANWLVTAAVPLGDTRYAYTLFTLYAVAGAMVLGEAARTGSVLPWRRGLRQETRDCSGLTL